MNFLSPSIRAFGLTLMAIGLVSVFLCTLWVYLYQDHSVVIAAQPLLLYSLCLGSTMVTLAILMSSYDESYIDDEETLSRLCNASVWLDSLGHMIAYGALFTKVRSTWCTSRVFFFARILTRRSTTQTIVVNNQLWRVNRCMRYKTNNIEIWRVMWPCTLLLTVVIILLSLLSSSGNFRWERQVIDHTASTTTATRKHTIPVAT